MRQDLQHSGPRWYARGLNNGAVLAATYHGVARLHHARRHDRGDRIGRVRPAVDELRRQDQQQPGRQVEEVRPVKHS